MLSSSGWVASVNIDLLLLRHQKPTMQLKLSYWPLYWHEYRRELIFPRNLTRLAAFARRAKHIVWSITFCAAAVRLTSIPLRFLEIKMTVYMEWWKRRIKIKVYAFSSVNEFHVWTQTLFPVLCPYFTCT